MTGHGNFIFGRENRWPRIHNLRSQTEVNNEHKQVQRNSKNLV